MTEAEWLACEDREAVVRYLWQKATDRKLRLLACGCCRCVWDSLPDERSRRAVEIAEQHADGLATAEELSEAAVHAEAACLAIDEREDRFRREQRAIRCAWLMEADAVEVGFILRSDGRQMSFDDARAFASGAQLVADHSISFLQEVPRWFLAPSVIHDVFGNPFRPVTCEAAWRSDTVVSLAKHIYEARDFSTLPILADALQDAGCDTDDILNHCRDATGTHVRGCWVVDLVLGKS